MSGFTTGVLHTSSLKKDVHGVLRFPIYDSASFEFESAVDIEKAFTGKKMAHSYSRISNPTVEFLETQIKSVTGAIGVLALSSGMAAISNVIMGLCSAGDSVITSKFIFGNTYSLFENTLKPWGLKTKYADFTKVESIVDQIDDNTRVIFLETITNPGLVIADIEKISSIAKEHGITLVVDSTLTPIGLSNLKKHGVDIEVVSSTKYISGGATSIGGLIIDYGSYKWASNPRFENDVKKFGPFCFLRKLRKVIYRDLGACLSPNSAYLQSLGLETFRLRVEKSSNNALTIAQFLERDNRVSRVNYPGLPLCKTEVGERLFPNGYGGLLTFNLNSKEECFRVIDNLTIIRRATNLNDNKTLIIHPASTIFCEYTPEEREEMGVPETMIRLSVGIEDVEDLIEDLKKALNTL